MTFATRLKATGQRLTHTYGQNITFTRDTEGTFVPSTGAVGTPTHSTFTAYGAPMAYTSREIDNVTILDTDMQLWMEVNAGGSVPLVGDVATISAIDFRVMNVIRYIAQGSTLLYRLQLRK